MQIFTTLLIAALALSSGPTVVDKKVKLELFPTDRPNHLALKITNESTSEVSFDPNYLHPGPARMSGYYQGRLIEKKVPYSFEGRPTSAREVIKSGQSVYQDFDLTEIFEFGNIPKAKVCFKMWWVFLSDENKPISAPLSERTVCRNILISK